MAVDTESSVINWSAEQTKIYLKNEGLSEQSLIILCEENGVDGKCLLLLNDSDFGQDPLNRLNLKDRKCLYLLCKLLQRENQNTLQTLGILEQHCHTYTCQNHYIKTESEYGDSERISPPLSEDGKPKYPPEKRKAFLSFMYVVAVTWITAFVMVIVHDRVPDMEKYPPLPDIFLDNVPLIPWAFDMCEITGTLLFTMWLIVLIFHKYRFILMRRFFALSGTVFLLRCVTMLITSLSVPGSHLQCQPRFYTTQANGIFADLARKLSQAFVIWRGAGLSIRGVRTCGDYMFSGHTVALTMLNFFITEYTPRHIYYLHTLSWMMNMFGIFFILAAHEHYSIDVFVAFYISSRLFLYYHTLSNNQALMQRDSTRTRVWFPLFSYFESSVEGIIPNEYESPKQIAGNIVKFIHGLFFDVKRQISQSFRSAPFQGTSVKRSRTALDNNRNSKTNSKTSINTEDSKNK
ncbi:ceramide phosphoethanolamine synthase [Diorhabda carinulata]|uniref:ceramide phosphoethanolamine synthase n=1 Tax=Diorhabda sublineata TaxID=1163346 RepID=UPI0024E1096B|nr:ceramide phosphoethanolamine synthase [Diorhabda sublineata]XP_057657525.1 ceramide phosphoethanolamine synthase [Diorhabda carinulata]